MKALVTGAAGFIGAKVSAALARRGIEVIAVDRPGASWARLGGAATRIESDLGAAGAATGLLGAHRPGILVHLAWYASPADYMVSRENLRSLAATLGLWTAALDSGCKRLVGIGTCLEYPAAVAPHREADPAGPDTLYASCKHAARVVGERLAEGAAAFAWARIFHLHGPGEDQRRLVPMVAGKLRRGEPVDLSAGEQFRDYLRVEDVADAVATVALSDVTGTVNVCSGEAVNLRRLLGAVAGVVGRPDLLRFGRVPYRTGERMRITGEPGVLRRLGWTPAHASLEDGLRYLDRGP